MRTYNDRLGRIKARCDEWGVWKRDWAHHRGWNVSVAEFDHAVGIQKRNDTHSDPVAVEVARIRREEWRHETTDSAYRELTRRLRRVIYARYVVYPDDRETSKARLAEKLGIRRDLLSDRLETALELMDATVVALIAQAKKSA